MDDLKSDLRTPTASTLTPEQLWREIASLKELVFTRIDAIEKTIVVAHEDAVRAPTEVQKQINYLREIYEARIDAVDRKFDDAVTALEKSVIAAFASLEKAIQKSEEGQKELNIKNNEFRGQLKDQAEHLMPRSESLANWKNASDRVLELKEQTEIKLDLVRKEIQVLREYRSEGGGKSAGVQQFWMIIVAAVGIIGTIVSVTVGISVLLRR